MSIFNAKEIIVNNNQIDYKLIRDYTTWDTFYDGCPLMQDLGESVKTYTKTFRIYENSNGLLFSNGIFYDKDNDILHTPTSAYRNWYSRLLLGYTVPKYFIYDSYSTNKMSWFGIIPDNEDSLVIMKNKCIGFRGFLNGGDLTIFEDENMINATKNVIVWKNSDTYATQKVEYLHPHEMYYSLNKLNQFTVFDVSSYFNDLSSKMDEVCSVFGFDIIAVSNLAAGVLFSTLGIDKDDVLPVFLDLYNNISYSNQRITSFSLKYDNTDKLVWNGYLGQEYLYNYRWDDWSNSITALNAYMNEEYDCTANMLKYISPQILYLNGNQLSYYDKYLSICNINAMLTDRTYYRVKGIADLIFEDDIEKITISNKYGSTVYLNNFDISTLKSQFFLTFPDLSTDAISSLIDDITAQDEILNDPTIYLPTLIVDSTSYSSIFTSTNISKLYLYSVIMWNIIKDFVSLESWIDTSANEYTFDQINYFDTNIAALDLASYDTLTSTTKYNTYVNKLLSLNLRFNSFPLYTDSFNPSIFDDLASISSSLSAYSTSSKFRSTYDESIFSLAEPDCKIEFDETSEDSTSLFFLAQSLQDINYEVFRGNDITNIQYQESGPRHVFLGQIDTSEYPTSDIKLEFVDDNTRLQSVPVDLETSNIVKIPYKGLLLLEDILDGENIQIQNLQLNRDLTTNSWMCKLTLNNYDQMDINRNITFRFRGGTELSKVQKIAYEFGLGFELVSSENIDNLEILRILYILISSQNTNDNIFIEKITEDPNKLKLIFKKLTSQPITLRTVVGYVDEEEIVDQVDTVI